MNWELVSFILSSIKREKVLDALSTPSTPTRVSKETGISKAHTTRILKKFEAMGIVQCKTPDKRKGKVYTLSVEGKKIRNKVLK
jgi:DNA-binding MarR family transcriptional regulator